MLFKLIIVNHPLLNTTLSYFLTAKMSVFFCFPVGRTERQTIKMYYCLVGVCVWGGGNYFLENVTRGFL